MASANAARGRVTSLARNSASQVPDGSWTYNIETELLVRGRSEPFNHHDTNTLKLVEAPTLNPLAVIRAARSAPGGGDNPAR